MRADFPREKKKLRRFFFFLARSFVLFWLLTYMALLISIPELNSDRCVRCSPESEYYNSTCVLTVYPKYSQRHSKRDCYNIDKLQFSKCIQSVYFNHTFGNDFFMRGFFLYQPLSPNRNMICRWSILIKRQNPVISIKKNIYRPNRLMHSDKVYVADRLRRSTLRHHHHRVVAQTIHSYKNVGSYSISRHR